jgi:uncharacterized protein (TIGR00730 family)
MKGLCVRSLCVFCGSSAGQRPAYAAAARELGGLLAARGIRLIYGGGRVGLMGELADAALRAGGEVVGVIPEGLMRREVGHPGLTSLHIVASMHERKALMADLADGFVALPGGFGTLEEFFEIVTWAQLGIHAKPCGLLDVEDFFQPLLALVEHAMEEGFIRPIHRALVLREQEPAPLLDAMSRFVPVEVEQWLGPPQR